VRRNLPDNVHRTLPDNVRRTLPDNLRRPRRRCLAAGLLAAPLLLAPLLLPGPLLNAALAAPPSRIDQAQRKLQAAQHDAAQHRDAEAAARAAAAAASQRADAIGREVAQAAASLQSLEAATAAAVAQLQSLNQQSDAARQALAEAGASLSRLLPVMQRLALQPSGTLLAIPEPPTETVRGAAVIAGIAAEIEQRASAVRTQTARLATLTQQTTAQRQTLRLAAANQAKAEAGLQAALDQAKATQTEANADAAREAAAAAVAASRAVSLRAMVDSLQRQAAAARAAEAQATQQQAGLVPRAGASANAMPAGAPVSGTLRSPFGAPTVAGPSTGMTFAATPGALVSSPCAGPVLFANRFQSYGLLVIIDCGDADDMVISGMARLTVGVGQRVVSGQPLGAMAGLDAKDAGATDAASQPLLYLELRHNGTPVDPAPYLAHRA
jgi:murein hydrolase activator